MPIIEVKPGAIFGTLTVISREGGLNGETTWRCEDDKGRKIVFPESEIMAKYGESLEALPEEAPEPAKEEEVKAEDVSAPEAEAEEPKGESEPVDSDPDTDCDEVPGGAAVAQSEPEQKEEEVTEEKPEPEVEKKPFFSKKNNNKGRK